KAAADVGAARDRREMHVLLPVAIHVIETLRQQGRTGGQNEPQRRQAMARARLQSGACAGGEIARAGAEYMKVFRVAEVGEALRRRMKGIAVGADERSADGETADLPV